MGPSKVSGLKDCIDYYERIVTERVSKVKLIQIWRFDGQGRQRGNKDENAPSLVHKGMAVGRKKIEGGGKGMRGDVETGGILVSVHFLNGQPNVKREWLVHFPLLDTHPLCVSNLTVKHLENGPFRGRTYYEARNHWWSEAESLNLG